MTKAGLGLRGCHRAVAARLQATRSISDKEIGVHLAQSVPKRRLAAQARVVQTAKSGKSQVIG
jgi:hypothetical protein